MCLEEPECMLDSFAWILVEVLLWLSLPVVIPVAWLLDRSIAEFFFSRYWLAMLLWAL